MCDLSASSVMDLAGARMLAELLENLNDRGIGLTVTNAHGRVRDLLRAEGLDDKIQGIAGGTLLETELHTLSEMVPRAGGLTWPACRSCLLDDGPRSCRGCETGPPARAA